MNHLVEEFVNRKVVVLKEEDKALGAAKAMCENQVGCVVVTNEKYKISGILTDRDLVCNLLSADLESNTPIKMIMETDVIWLAESATIDEAINLMKLHGIRRLPIVEESKKGHQKCIGVVTMDDLIARELVSVKDLSDVVKSQILRRKRISPKPIKGDSKLDHTYNKFISRISKEMELDKVKSEDVILFILSSIIQRLHYSGGVQFISQLPKRMQEQLLDLPAGPDRAITDKSIIQGISIRTGKDLNSSKDIASQFWKALCMILGPGETDHVIHQLPLEMKDLLSASMNIESEKLLHVVIT